jgi:pimeloyl-ACP methyl ester carboxylesterase
MSDTSGYISVGSERLHYLQWGSGKKLLLAFHGYGDDAEIYAPMRDHLVNDYTILSVNLPHHGESKWGNTSLSKKDLVALVQKIKTDYTVDKLSLLGYSLGARVCMVILEQLPASIDKVLLLAPDGLRVDPYFYFFTNTALGKKMFRNMLEKPEPYISMVNSLRKVNMVHASRHKFAMHFLQSEERRSFLLKVWPGLSELVPNTAKVKRAIRQYRIPVFIFMGVHDKIINPSIAKKFKSGLDTVKLTILEKGHRVLDEYNAKQIAESLL